MTAPEGVGGDSSVEIGDGRVHADRSRWQRCYHTTSVKWRAENRGLAGDFLGGCEQDGDENGNGGGAASAGR